MKLIFRSELKFFTIFTTLSGSSLSNFAADLANLEVLNLSNNRLSNLSRVKLPRLLHLDISENRFSKWSVAPLPHCHVVNAAGNQLISISEIEFGSPRITILNLAENFLVETPAKLRFLSILNCSNNSIEHLKTNSIFLNKVRYSLIHEISDIFSDNQGSTDRQTILLILVQSEVWNSFSVLVRSGSRFLNFSRFGMVRADLRFLKFFWSWSGPVSNF